MSVSDNQTNILDAPTRVAIKHTDAGLNSHVDDELPAIAGYQVMRELGRGGMGVVYLARQLSLDRLVALKTIQPRCDSGFADLLVSEAQIVGRLNHPAIVPIYEACTAGNVWYFSMGFVKGDDLAHRLAKGVMNTEQVVRLAVEICEALEHAHSQQILHLDIKPANILLDPAERPKLTDFGLSAIHASKFEGRETIGTPQFMSPEQALGAISDLSPAADIYALGAVMYAAIVGRPPIVSANPQDLLLKVISQPPTPLRQIGLRVPKPFEAILLKCLQKQPKQRYQSAQALKEDLLAFAAGQPVKARPPSLWSIFEYQLKRHVLAASVSGSAALVLLLLVGAVIARSWSQTNEIFELQTENDRLKQVIALQRQLTQGRIEQKDVAVKLAESGDLDYAAFFAAEALQLNSKIPTKEQEALTSIIHAYADRHPLEAGNEELLDELVARVAADGELRQSKILTAEPDSVDQRAAANVPLRVIQPK